MIQELCEYETNGFLVTRPLFSDDELCAISDIVNKAVQQANNDPKLAQHCVFERDQPASKRNGITVEEDDTSVFIIGNIIEFFPELARYLVKDTLVRYLKTILQTDELVIHFANVTNKSANIGSGIALHRDFPNKYICPEEPKMVRTMICIDGMSEVSGATEFVNGSNNNVENSDKEYSTCDTTIVTCPPGSVVAIHPLVLHGGRPNSSKYQRRNIVVQWGIADIPMKSKATEFVTGMTLSELERLDVNL